MPKFKKYLSETIHFAHTDNLFLISHLIVWCCHWKQDSHSKACCRGRTSWSQTTQGNGILINESCDIAPLFIHTHRKIKEFLKLSTFVYCYNTDMINNGCYIKIFNNYWSIITKNVYKRPCCY
jgi:hypothetical protein